MWRGALVAVGASALACCAPRPAPAPAEPDEAPRPQAARPQPVPAPPPPAEGWEDAPLSPGDWSYGADGAGSVARYGTAGQPALLVRCDQSRRIAVARLGAPNAPAITIRTTSGARSIAAGPQQGALVATLAPDDPFLDIILFSRGRFSVEAPGAPMLLVPTWPEVARVVEDCRG